MLTKRITQNIVRFELVLKVKWKTLIHDDTTTELKIKLLTGEVALDM